MMHARRNVVLKHRTQTLYTDSLDYDRLYDNAYFFEGGKLIDGKDELVSDWGEYNTATRKAAFFYDVHMRSGENIINTDSLHYDTRTRIAHVTGPSTIKSKSTVINTTDAYTNSKTNMSQLFGRSTIVDGKKTITGDSLFHNDKLKQNEGFGNVIYTDTENKNELRCDHLFYNETTGYGYATKRALMLDYSQKDTLYVHADSLKLYTFNIETDSVYRKVRLQPCACLPRRRAGCVRLARVQLARLVHDDVPRPDSVEPRQTVAGRGDTCIHERLDGAQG